MPLIHVHLLPSLAAPGSLRGCPVVIVDLLRASTTIVRALDAGATRVHPCLEPDEARTIRDSLAAAGTSPERVVLGGERGGVRIPGFDVGNSPAEYTPAMVGGRALVFTTTNGTRALFAARGDDAAAVLVGCLNNLAAVTHRVRGMARRQSRDVHILCAGTNGQISLEDVLCAGAMVDGLLYGGLMLGDDDGARIALDLWLHARAGPSGSVERTVRGSRGGHNLLALGLEDDITDCAAIDTSETVPVLTQDGSIGVEESA